MSQDGDTSKSPQPTSKPAPHPIHTELTAAIGTFLNPGPVDIGVKITQTVAAQEALSAQIQSLTRQLQEAATATEKAPPPSEVENYVSRLKQCRSRVVALQRTLSSTRQRLTRVHAHVVTKAERLEKQNATDEAALVAELEQLKK